MCTLILNAVSRVTKAFMISQGRFIRTSSILLRKQITSNASQISPFDFLGSSYTVVHAVPGGEAAFLYISIVL